MSKLTKPRFQEAIEYILSHGGTMQGSTVMISDPAADVFSSMCVLDRCDIPVKASYGDKEFVKFEMAKRGK